MSDFEEKFLENYLRYGLGAMPKGDIDALVVHLLDRYGGNGHPPFATKSNQTVSETLKVPLSKIKRLRYEAALKFGERAEDEAQGRLLAALARATIEVDGSKVNLILEDTLAKNWLQGQLKAHAVIFDNSFNAELIKVPVEGLLKALDAVFDEKSTAAFRATYDAAKQKSDSAARRDAVKAGLGKFVEGAAKAAGKSVVQVLKAQLGAL